MLHLGARMDDRVADTKLYVVSGAVDGHEIRTRLCESFISVDTNETFHP
jgi:hypothetical protein